MIQTRIRSAGEHEFAFCGPQEGDVKWQELFQVAETGGGIQWYIFEQESYPPPLTPFEAVEKSQANLHKLLAQRTQKKT